MQAVFAVTSTGGDLYAAMTRVAVASLRLSNPRMRVIVVCDAQTNQALTACRSPLIGEVDDWRVVATPAGSAGFRNRFVKTRLREALQGAFLFIDSDMLVRGDLSALFALDADVAGARNHSRQAVVEQVWSGDQATLDAMGWRVRPDVYINGGLFYLADTEGARRLGDEWRRRWLQSFVQRGSYRDQPALNASLMSTQASLAVLDDKFNAQFKTSPAAAFQAVAWHYYASDDAPRYTRFEQTVYEVQQGAELDGEVIRAMISHWHPWPRDEGVRGWLDDLAASRVIRRGRFGGWPAAQLKRELAHYVWRKLGRVRRA